MEIKMMSTTEVATLLGCTKRNIIRMVHAGQLEPVNSQKSFYLFDEKQVLTLKSMKDERKKINRKTA